MVEVSTPLFWPAERSPLFASCPPLPSSSPPSMLVTSAFVYCVVILASSPVWYRPLLLALLSLNVTAASVSGPVRLQPTLVDKKLGVGAPIEPA